MSSWITQAQEAAQQASQQALEEARRECEGAGKCLPAHTYPLTAEYVAQVAQAEGAKIDIKNAILGLALLGLGIFLYKSR